MILTSFRVEILFIDSFLDHPWGKGDALVALWVGNGNKKLGFFSFRYSYDSE
ncbi:hypothetical protein SLEP1_g37936 [Rubroshorea leprosula]|uniref:Uncharacterized protein n=1 Tax=Rubroshorea leprosula TaxID=152421 RepID=A0AAV5KWE0_9ROSI|nr:hypothetical protein SLEP1_g37936 [Rubroshorea leprosula]